MKENESKPNSKVLGMTEPFMAGASAYGWDDLAPTPAHAYLWPGVRRMLGDIDGPLRILDLGCGNGWIAGRLAAEGHKVVGMDASPDGIALAQVQYSQVDFRIGSVYDYILDLQGQFDVVLATEVIEHLYHPRALVQRASEYLCPGGSLILSTPFHGYLKNLAIAISGKWDQHHTVLRDGGHIKFFSRQTLRLMLEEQGFQEMIFVGVGRVPWLWKSMIVKASYYHR